MSRKPLKAKRIQINVLSDVNKDVFAYDQFQEAHSGTNVSSKISPILILLSFMSYLKSIGCGRWNYWINFSDTLIFLGGEHIFSRVTYLPWTNWSKIHSPRTNHVFTIFCSVNHEYNRIVRSKGIFYWEIALEPPKRVTGINLWAWERFTQRLIAILLIGNSINRLSSTL